MNQNQNQKQLTCKYQLTEHERAAAIFNIPALGDERPSQIMDRMLHLLGGCEGGILFRYHFISILPIYVKGGHSSSTQVLRYPFSPQQHTPDVILPLQHLNWWQLTGVSLHHMEPSKHTYNSVSANLQ